MTTTPDECLDVELDSIDLADPDLYATGDFLTVWRYLQKHAPVFFNRSSDDGFWAVTKHREAMAVYTDRSFTSERGMRVGGGAASRASGSKMVIVTDGSRHRQLRDLMAPPFSPRAARAMEGNMRAVVRGLLDRARGLAEFDFVDLIAAQLPLYVTCQLLGVPDEDRDLVIDWTRKAFGSVAGDGNRDVVTPQEQAEAHAAIFLYATELLAERRRRPRDDIVSALAHGTIDGRPVTEEEVMVNVNGVLTGGNETTRHASAGAIEALAAFPGEWQELKDSPGIPATAIEEVLRWTAPSLHVMRTAIRDVTIGDQLVRAGQEVSVWNPAVNRDGDQFPEPLRFDVTRTPNRHLTFGTGNHVCIGGTLARTELRVLLEEVVASVASIEVRGPVRRLRSNLMWGLDQLPVHFEWEADR
ncbi:MAG TPA: cytochrome P450 [Streptosporangiaceae bacterium]|nr:cytochrome P450 [Streptosporangiaceae bacterium]